MCEHYDLIKYSDYYDTKYCPRCDEWLEKKCDDELCEYCDGRPEHPSESFR